MKEKAFILMESAEVLVSPSELEILSSLTAFVREAGWTLVGALIEPAGEEFYSVEFKRMLSKWRDAEVQYVVTWNAEEGCPGVYDTEFPGFPDVRGVDAVLEAPDPREDAEENEDLANYVRKHLAVILAGLGLFGRRNAAADAIYAKEELEDLMGIEP